VGERRLAATKNVSILRSLYESIYVFLGILREKRMLLTLGILAAYSLVGSVNDSYWATFVVEYLGLRESDLSWFAMVKGAVTLCAILILVPRLKRMSFRRPMLTAIAMLALAQGTLLTLSAVSAPLAVVWPALILSVCLEAMAIALLSPLTSSMLYFHADPEERARIYGMVYATISLMVCLFPFVIGLLADKSLYYPYLVNLGLFAAIALLTVLIAHFPLPEHKSGEN
jgi:Na+/melibiose symporter-like transporter